jgi:hypothetical protein
VPAKVVERTDRLHLELEPNQVARFARNGKKKRQVQVQVREQEQQQTQIPFGNDKEWEEE